MEDNTKTNVGAQFTESLERIPTASFITEIERQVEFHKRSACEKLMSINSTNELTEMDYVLFHIRSISMCTRLKDEIRLFHANNTIGSNVEGSPFNCPIHGNSSKSNDKA